MVKQIPNKEERRIIPMKSLSKKSKKVIEELTAFLGRDYYERRTNQEGSRAGSKPRTIKIGCGDIGVESI